MKNKKGFLVLGVQLVNVSAGVLAFSLVKVSLCAALVAAAWHIPAWEKAKLNHTEESYQASKMWPQQLFAKLPGGDYVAPKVEESHVGGHLRAELLALQK